MSRTSIVLSLLIVASVASAGEWPAEIEKVKIPCSDGVDQNAMWYAGPDGGEKPLLVGLHTWSSTFEKTGGEEIYARWCLDQGWAFLHPDFRGQNWKPDAMGSDRAVLDIVEAVDWAKKRTGIDESRIYLVGVSGGGHMALMMAGRHPEIWAGVSAWCGISDLPEWHRHHTNDGEPGKYARHIEESLGGSPFEDAALMAEARRRSPLSHLARADVPLDINHGVLDGRKGSVPFTHSLRAFNAVARPSDRLNEEEVRSYYETMRLPEGWAPASADRAYADKQPLFRATSGLARVTIFDGRHEIVHQAALNWLALQRKGGEVLWSADSFIELETPSSESGK